MFVKTLGDVVAASAFADDWRLAMMTVDPTMDERSSNGRSFMRMDSASVVGAACVHVIACIDAAMTGMDWEPDDAADVFAASMRNMMVWFFG